jgi:hypothetical protein
MSLMEATLGEEIFQEQMMVERLAIPANTELIIGIINTDTTVTWDLVSCMAKPLSNEPD